LNMPKRGKPVLHAVGRCRLSHALDKHSEWSIQLLI
jgi:hypothetical protein